jgi:hypothetical protein
MQQLHQDNLNQEASHEIITITDENSHKEIVGKKVRIQSGAEEPEPSIEERSESIGSFKTSRTQKPGEVGENSKNSADWIEAFEKKYGVTLFGIALDPLGEGSVEPPASKDATRDTLDQVPCQTGNHADQGSSSEGREGAQTSDGQNTPEEQNTSEKQAVPEASESSLTPPSPHIGGSEQFEDFSIARGARPPLRRAAAQAFNTIKEKRVTDHEEVQRRILERGKEAYQRHLANDELRRKWKKQIVQVDDGTEQKGEHSATQDEVEGVDILMTDAE